LYGAKRIAASLNDDKDFPPINHKKVDRVRFLVPVGRVSGTGGSWVGSLWLTALRSVYARAA
ncbi:hypothetical protein QP979_13110, partial [Corynebacterium striatum]|uniref:hypothetical protein n=1 Tax=Corynebacterium striatum TaxID=43770 RepID=UPI00254E959A